MHNSYMHDIRYLNVKPPIAAIRTITSKLKRPEHPKFAARDIPRVHLPTIAKLLRVDSIIGTGTTFMYCVNDSEYEDLTNIGTYYGKTMVVVLSGHAGINIVRNCDGEELFDERLSEGDVVGFIEEPGQTLTLTVGVMPEEATEVLVVLVDNFNEYGADVSPMDYLF